MKTPPHLLPRSAAVATLVSLWAVSSPFASGQAAPPRSPLFAEPVLSAPESLPPSAPVPSRGRVVSADLAAKLSDTAPKFSPPKTENGNPAAALDLRETDKPRNGIVRLPNYIVREPEVPVFPRRELLTPAGKLDLAYKRRPGLRLGSLPIFSNDGIARFMLEEEFKLERIAEMQELASLLSYTPESVADKKKVQASTADVQRKE